MFDQNTIPTLHNGLISASLAQVAEMMPEITDLLTGEGSPAIFAEHEYRFDVKVHMLMPGQYPCIPGVHMDFVPRDEDRNLCPELIEDDVPPMFLWISGPPFTEFVSADGVPFSIEPQAWFPFSQRDAHRGTVAKEHGWRLFIRAAPIELVPDHALAISGLRRHSQVYLNAEDFAW